MDEVVDKIELKASTIFIDGNGFVRIIHKDQVEMGLEEAKEHAEACYKVCSGKPMCFLIDSRDKIVLVTAEARKYLAHHEGLIKTRKAHAIIVDSLPNRLLANFYFKFNKPVGPGKVFNSEKAALSWLSKYK